MTCRNRDSLAYTRILLPEKHDRPARYGQKWRANLPRNLAKSEEMLPKDRLRAGLDMPSSKEMLISFTGLPQT